MSFSWNFHHWLQWMLLFWQLMVQPVLRILLKWYYSHFIDLAQPCRLCQCAHWGLNYPNGPDADREHDDVIKMGKFSALLAICAGNSPVLGEFPSQRPVTPSFDVFFDLRSIEKKWSWMFHSAAQNFTNRVFVIRTLLKQYNCHESATIWYTDHQYLTQYSEIINNLQEIPLLFRNCAVRSCGTRRKGPGQSPRNVLSSSDLELYVTERGTGVGDPVTD